MKMTDEDMNGVKILKLDGVFDASAAPEVERFFQKIPSEPLPSLVMDLSGVEFIDSTGLSTLVIGMKRCREQHGTLVLYGTQGPVKSVFKLTLLDKVFTMFDTQEEAIAYVQKSQAVESGGAAL